MLDPWIIEEIRRREEQERERQPAVIELPLDQPPIRRDEREQGKQEETPRGIAIIEI